MGGDAARLVDRQLLADRQMQAQVQEGVGFAGIRQIIALGIAFRIIENGVVFGVLLHQVERDGFEVGQRLPFAIFLPGIEEEAARLVTGRVKYGGLP